MKIKSLLALAALGLLAGGCASPNVNPASARPGTGYVDFYADNADGLWWNITDVKGNQTIFYETSPVPGPILRLAFMPGQYQLRVTVLNHAVIAPGVTDVEVQDRRVTPVTVTLLPAGTVMVETKQAHAGGTYYGRYGRRTKIRDTEAVNYEVIAEPQPLLPYQPKAQMPYAVAPKD
jgi:hypothetical protein